jgi:hypothetical protein
MSKFTEFLEKYGQVMIDIFWAIIIIGIAFFVAILVAQGTGNEELKTKVWFWFALVSYLIINSVIIRNAFIEKAENILIIADFVLAGILFAGFILHLFIDFPIPIKIICGWPAIIGTLSLIMLAFASFIFLGVVNNVKGSNSLSVQ